MNNAIGTIPKGDFSQSDPESPGKVLDFVKCRSQTEKKYKPLSEKNSNGADSRSATQTQTETQSAGSNNNGVQYQAAPHGFGEALSWLWRLVWWLPFGKEPKS